MKTRVLCVMISVLFVSLDGYSQTSEWINYVNGDKLAAIADGGDCLWIGTCGGGLVRLDKGTDSLAFYTKANAGIPGNCVIALSMDTSGNIWMGTRRNGIGVFDAETCTIYNEENSGLPLNQWNTVIQTDSKGNAWIGSLFWITKFDGTTWNSYEAGDLAAAFSAIWDIEFGNDGAAWIGASWGLGKLDGEELIEYEEVTQSVSSLSIDADDNLWIGTDGAGLVRFDGEHWDRFDTGNSEIPGNKIYCMKFDSEGALWLGTTEGLVKFDGVHWRTYNTDNSELLENTIFSIEIDAQDNIWLGLSHEGLMKFDGTNWRRYKLSNSGLPNNFIGSFALDTHNNRWITCQGDDGLVQFDGMSWAYYDTTNYGYLDTYFRRVYDDGPERIWTGSGVIIILEEAHTWRAYNTDKLHKGSPVKIDGEGNIWKASNEGLWKFDGEKWTVYDTDNSPLPSNLIRELAFDHQGNLWLSTMSDMDRHSLLIKYDGTDWKVVYTCSYGHVSSIEIDPSGNIWVGIFSSPCISCGEGLKKFDGKTWTEYTIYNSALPSNSVVELCFDGDNNLWIGTYGGGLAKFNGENEWAIYNTQNSGLPGNNVELIEIDSVGNKWLNVQFGGLSVFRQGGVLVTGIEDGDKEKPIEMCLSLGQNCPNPFNANTAISFTLHRTSHINIAIYNLLGQLVRELTDRKVAPGVYRVLWDGRDDADTPVASGIYLYRMTTEEGVITKKMILMR